jgi:hypothetical protein
MQIVNAHYSYFTFSVIRIAKEIISDKIFTVYVNTYMRRLTTGISSEKCVVRPFRRCANIMACTYADLDCIAY